MLRIAITPLFCSQLSTSWDAAAYSSSIILSCSGITFKSGLIIRSLLLSCSGELQKWILEVKQVKSEEQLCFNLFKKSKCRSVYLSSIPLSCSSTPENCKSRFWKLDKWRIFVVSNAATFSHHPPSSPAARNSKSEFWKLEFWKWNVKKFGHKFQMRQCVLVLLPPLLLLLPLSCLLTFYYILPQLDSQNMVLPSPSARVYLGS